MNNDKQDLFTANGSYLGKALVAVAFLFPVSYGVMSRGLVDYNEMNILMFPLGVMLLLIIAATTEACMMIRSGNYLFAYNVDKAICLPLDKLEWDRAVAIARKLYGPVFDADCAQRFTISPKSPFLRKVFYSLVVFMFMISAISPCYHLIEAFSAGFFSSKLIASWIFIILDATVIVNRIFFRASVRKFWAMTLGDDNFRSILNFELSNDNNVLPTDAVVIDEKYRRVQK